MTFEMPGDRGPVDANSGEAGTADAGAADAGAIASPRRRPRLFAYAVLALIGVALVAVMWTTMHETRSTTALITTSPKPEAPVVTVENGDAVGADVSVRSPDGTVYEAPYVKLSRSSHVLLVQQTMLLPEADGEVEVSAPQMTVVLSGTDLALDREVDEQTRRAHGGEYTGFMWTADLADTTASDDIEVGDTITLRVSTPDGLTYDVAVAVADWVRLS